MIRGGCVLLAASLAALPACVGALPGGTPAGDTGGSGGSGGTPGSGGMAGVPGRGGAPARGGAPGPTGAAGSGPGPTGAAGTGPPLRFMCPSSSILDCTGSPLTLTDGHVTSFTPWEWSPTEGHTCNASGLRGSVFSYSGPDATSAAANSVDSVTGNFHLMLTVGPGGYAGGGIAFDRCVNASAFSALRFSAWITGGNIAGCNYRVMLQTFEQRPSSQVPPGGCDQGLDGCFRFPSSPNLVLAPIPAPTTVLFSDFTTSATHANPVPGELVGLQWQLESGLPAADGGLQPGCTVEIRIDDIDFVVP